MALDADRALNLHSNKKLNKIVQPEDVGMTGAERKDGRTRSACLSC